MSQATVATGWQAGLKLGFTRLDGVTRLSHREHHGPLLVQRPFHPETGDCCHCYILHPPGGVVGGDTLTLDVWLDHGARALLTTPAAAKFYRSAGPAAVQRQTLHVADGALLEWLPQEAILFDGARLDGRIRIELTEDARFIGWELYCLGRPAAGERFTRGHADLRLELWRDDRPLLLERQKLPGGGEALASAWGLAGRPVFGTLLCTPAPESADALRIPLEETEVTATVLDGVLVCRYRGDSTARARALFARVWSLLRPALAGRPASTPRVWST